MGNELVKDGSSRHGYTSADIIKLRKDGRPKPPEITWAEWNAPFKLNDNHEIMAHMAAAGKRPKDIADELGYSYQRVALLLNGERMKFRVKELQYQLFGKNQQRRFETLAAKAIDSLEEVVSDAKEKGTTRVMAAKEILDRAYGKPKQTIEHRDSKISSLYDKLDDILGTKQKKKDDVIIEEAHYSEVQNEREDEEVPNEEEIQKNGLLRRKNEEKNEEEIEVDRFLGEFYGPQEEG